MNPSDIERAIAARREHIEQLQSMRCATTSHTLAEACRRRQRLLAREMAELVRQRMVEAEGVGRISREY